MAEGAIIELTDDNFDSETATDVTVVDFWAPWCGPCRMQTPIMDKVAETIGERATIAKMNVEENTATPGKLGIRGIPTVIIFKDGEEVERLVGVQQETPLVKTIEKQIDA